MEPARWFGCFSCLIGGNFPLKVIVWYHGRGISLKGNTPLFLVMTAATAALTRINLRRTLAPTMPAGFCLHPLVSDSSATSQISARQVDAARPVAQLYGAFAKVKALVADFRANEKFYRSPAYSDESRAGQE
ncbi:MAG: hypothetical protein ABSF10_21755 [Verrucomicrobiota bacterium]